MPGAGPRAGVPGVGLVREPGGVLGSPRGAREGLGVLGWGDAGGGSPSPRGRAAAGGGSDPGHSRRRFRSGPGARPGGASRRGEGNSACVSYGFIYKCINTCVFWYIYTYKCVCIFIYFHVNVHICVYFGIFTCLFMHIRVFLWQCGSLGRSQYPSAQTALSQPHHSPELGFGAPSWDFFPFLLGPEAF